MKAMILAAGMGTRLRELSRNTPKCLIAVGGKPMLEYVVLRLKRLGVTGIAINLHHLKDQVEDFVRAQNNFGLDVYFSYEQELLGTGGGIKHAEPFFADSPNFIVYNADVYSELDLAALWQDHLQHQAFATLAVRDKCTPDHLVCDEHGDVQGWINERSGNRELVKTVTRQVPVTFACVHVASKRVFDSFRKEAGAFSIFKPYLNAVRAGERLRTYHIGSSYWIDMGTPEQLVELQQRLTSAPGVS